MMRPSRRQLMQGLGAAALPLPAAGAGETPGLSRMGGGGSRRRTRSQ